MKDYSRGRHTVFYHRYHLVWITKYRYRVMNHEVKKRVRELVAQVLEEIGVNISVQDSLISPAMPGRLNA
uniref:Transposase IS200 like n=1 Tax=Candidatus Kentrum eta TaxID=2126337 RepID=A0A450VQP4_9GAMM|nr:MAG: Transposase IS200 like [Candidatus Kentron sp. H]VFK04284.1 MAG: Transposase IS200 like [Candidatus Kentron sp. H]VFK07110.1 MAG: Transposase IS200 like [Candidatus Kentron sp. H]